MPAFSSTGTIVWVSRQLAEVADSGKCSLLGGTFATLVQGALGLICISALVIKRNNEVPQRDWYVWFLDVMKQAIGSGFGHFANIFLSMFIAGTITDADECQWYCLTFVVDATVGTVINLVLLTCFEQQVQRNPNCSVMKFGEYGDPPQLSIWFPQLMVWLGIVVVAKVITLLLLFQFLAPLDVLISAIFAIFHGHPELELVTVMIVIPTIMNIMQFWVTDTFLKRQPLSGEDGADSDLDEELISGGGGAMEEYNYRPGAPMRGVVRGGGAGGAAGGAGQWRTAALSEGIQLSSFGPGSGAAGGGGYSTLSTASSHGPDSGENSPVQDARSAHSVEEGRGRLRLPASPSRNSGSAILPGFLSGLGAYLPSALTGIQGGKLERVGSDEGLHSRGSTKNSSGGSSSGGVSGTAAANRIPLAVGQGHLQHTESASGAAGASAGSAAVVVKDTSSGGLEAAGAVKGYYARGSGIIKQRSTGSGGGGSNYSLLGSGGGATGAPAVGGAGRSGSADSAEEKDIYL